MLLPTKANALTKALREPNTRLSLSIMRSLLIFHLILLMLLQLILSKASQDSPTDRAENPMTGLMPEHATSNAAMDGAADTTLAVSGLFAVLGMLWSWSVLVGDSEIGHRLERDSSLLLLAVLLLVLVTLLAVLVVLLSIRGGLLAVWLLLAIGLLVVLLVAVALVLGLALIAAVLLLVVGVRHCGGV